MESRGWILTTRSAAAMAAVIVMLLSACANGNVTNSSTSQGEEASRQAVSTITVRTEPIGDSYMLSGTLRAAKESIVSFEADGRVLETYADEGDAVEKGAKLAVLDASAYTLQLNRAEAAVLQAQAAVRQSEAAVLAAQAGVESASESDSMQNNNALLLAQAAYEKAQTDLERSQALYEEGLISMSDLENANLAFVQAETNLLNAEAQGRQTNTGIESAQATLAQAEAGLLQAEAAYKEALAARDQVKLTVNNTVLKAPMSGVVLEKLVAADQLTGGGQPAYRIGVTRQLKVTLPVPDRHIRDWSAGQTVQLELYGETRTGTVETIFPQLNYGSGSVNVEVTIDNSEGDWLPGQIVSATLATEAGENALLVPIEAVISNGGEPYVFKVVDGKAVKTVVATGELVGNRIRITSGLADGDSIVTKGAGKLFDGDQLETAEGQES